MKRETILRRRMKREISHHIVFVLNLLSAIFISITFIMVVVISAKTRNNDEHCEEEVIKNIYENLL